MKNKLRKLQSLSANDTTATATLNANFEQIEKEILNTLSRDGTQPNYMDADFDLNGHKIINIAEPEDDGDVVTKRYVDENNGNAYRYSLDAAQSASRAASSAQQAGISASNALANANYCHTVADDILNDENIQGLAADLASEDSVVKAVEAIQEDVTTVAGIASDISTVANSAADISAVSDDLTNIDTVTSNIADVNTVAGVALSVATVADNTANINTVAGIDDNITTVAGIASDVTTVAGVASDVSTVADNTANINTVVSNTSTISAVANNVSNINTVANSISDVNTVAADISNVSAVALDLTNINAVAADLENIDNASTYANNANIWAEGTDEQVQALGGVHSSKGWADQSSQGQVQADWDETDSTEKSYIKNKPTNLVTTDTAQPIRADKSFSGGLYKDNTNLDINTNPTTQINNQIWFRDRLGIGYATIQTVQATDGTLLFNLTGKARSKNSFVSMGLVLKPDGSGSTIAPTPASSDNSTKIATTAFVKSSSSGYSTYKSGATISLNTDYTVPSNGVIAGEISAAQNGWVQVNINGVTVEQVGSEPSQRCRAPFYAIVKKGQVVKLATSGNATASLAKFYAFS